MNLLEPITIRGVEFKNRMVMAPMLVGIGIRSARARAYYLERARGGVGTIIMAGTSVDVFATDDAWGRAGGVDAFLDGIRPVTDDIHQTGTKVGIQLWHGNIFPAGMGNPLDTQGEPVAPSATNERRELTIPEIDTIIARFAQACANARQAGFDFIEVHGAHGYLTCQFFSPATNRRNDRYGGDLSGRMRFGTECVAKIRSAIGSDFPIFYRLGAWEDIPDGITTNDSAQFAAELEKAGVDVIDVSLGAMTRQRLTSSPGPEYPEGTLVPFAETIKRNVSVPVIAVGRFRTAEAAEAVLVQGKADMIAIGRQLIADPHWPEKATTGRAEDIVPCISCDTCFEPVRAGTSLRCSVNTLAGREAELKIEPALKPKRVMVVGGGPGGMEAARVTAQRGHHVTLYERQNELGGQLIPASTPPYKYELAHLKHYLARQLEKNGVQVKLGVEVTPETVERERPDAFISAIGPVSLTPEIQGLERNKVVTDLDVLSGKVDVGDRVVIIGGELSGCETADFLSEQGKKVTVIRRGPEMATGVFPSARQALLNRLEEKGVILMPGIKEYQGITAEGLLIINKEGKSQLLEADSIVLATGVTANDRLAKAVQGKVGEVHMVGDCAEPGRILDAIRDGSRVGRNI
ncbi:MAG: FAD-dependent oxidoreductase [Dehalococcoidales bacterium]|nr:MAG: FAD-dependent oxidoreductase [Dehalococcoidales bacterium]